MKPLKASDMIHAGDMWIGSVSSLILSAHKLARFYLSEDTYIDFRFEVGGVTARVSGSRGGSILLRPEVSNKVWIGVNER